MAGILSSDSRKAIEPMQIEEQMEKNDKIGAH
jgi:hypothetical protein